MDPGQANDRRQRRYRLMHFKRLTLPLIQDFAPSPPKPPSPLERNPRLAQMGPVLCFWGLAWVVSMMGWLHRGPFATVSGATVERIQNEGEWWRLVSALFMHADAGHLLSNTPLLLVFGWYLRDYFGLLAFPLVPVAVGVLSNIVTLWTYDPGTELMGASGMLYGMIALWLVLYVHFETQYSRSVRIFRAIGTSLLLLAPTTYRADISYTAHLTGFLLGLVAGLALRYRVQVRP